MTTTSCGVTAAALVAGLALSGCTAKDSAPTATSAGAAEVSVDATDTACAPSTSTAGTGATTFAVTNNGDKVTEFYVYGPDDRVLAEVENVSPGLTRKLVVEFNEPGTYRLACKPGMVGDGIRADFAVAGAAVAGDDSAMAQTASQDYKAYLVDQSDELLMDTTAFVGAIKAGDVAEAKSLYPVTREPYERMEPVAESFPDDLDPRIDLREADLESGQTWTGFHRLEKDLWVTGIQPDTGTVADQLLGDVTALRQKVQAPDFSVDATQIAGGAQGLLDEIAASKITGEEDIFSHTDLWDFQANLEGSRAAIAAVRPILDERDAALGTRVDKGFADVTALLARYRAGDGFVIYTSVTEPQRQELSRAIDALSKDVSQVQGVIAPR